MTCSNSNLAYKLFQQILKINNKIESKTYLYYFNDYKDLNFHQFIRLEYEYLINLNNIKLFFLCI